MLKTNHFSQHRTFVLSQAVNYDVGVYFEANGHGTIIFSQGAVMNVKQALQSATNPVQKKGEVSNHVIEYMHDTPIAALHNLSCLVDMVNQAIGDAISDILLVEAILILVRIFASCV